MPDLTRRGFVGLMVGVLIAPLARLRAGGTRTWSSLPRKLKRVFTGYKILMIEVPGKEQIRTIVQYNPATRRATVSPPWDLAPGPDAQFLLFAPSDPPTLDRGTIHYTQPAVLLPPAEEAVLCLR